jgi:hypothetical protein
MTAMQLGLYDSFCGIDMLIRRTGLHKLCHLWVLFSEEEGDENKIGRVMLFLLGIACSFEDPYQNYRAIFVQDMLF